MKASGGGHCRNGVHMVLQEAPWGHWVDRGDRVMVNGRAPGGPQLGVPGCYQAGGRRGFTILSHHQSGEDRRRGIMKRVKVVLLPWLLRR